MEKLVLGTLLALSFCFAHASDGGMDGGGGSSVRLSDGRTLLVDLYEANPQLQDTAGPEPRLRTAYFRDRPVVENGIRYRGLIVQEQSFYPELQQKLFQLEQNSPVLASVLRQAIGSQMQFLVLDMELPRTDFVLSNTADVVGTETVAIYLNRLGGPAIAAQAFARLGNLSRQALVVHEALRYIEADAGTRTARIQQITAQVILNPSQARLDVPELYLGINMQRALTAYGDAVRISSTREHMCEQMAALTTQFSNGVLERAQDDLCDFSISIISPVNREGLYRVWRYLAGLDSDDYYAGLSSSAKELFNQINYAMSELHFAGQRLELGGLASAAIQNMREFGLIRYELR